MKAKIFLVLIVCFLFGALIAPFFSSEPKLYYYLFVFFFFVSFFIFNQRILWTFVLGVSLIFLSIALFQNQTLKYEILNNDGITYSGKIKAIVTDIPTETEYGKTTRVNILLPFYNQDLILYFKDNRNIRFGDILEFEGKIKKYEKEKKAILIKQKVIGEVSANRLDVIGHDDNFSIKGKLFEARVKMNEALFRLLPSKEAGLASGLVLGEKSRISPETKRFLETSGTSHIIALSGYNITIILAERNKAIIEFFGFPNNLAKAGMNPMIPALTILAEAPVIIINSVAKRKGMSKLTNLE